MRWEVIYVSLNYYKEVFPDSCTSNRAVKWKTLSRKIKRTSGKFAIWMCGCTLLFAATESQESMTRLSSPPSTRLYHYTRLFPPFFNHHPSRRPWFCRLDLRSWYKFKFYINKGRVAPIPSQLSLETIQSRCANFQIISHCKVSYNKLMKASLSTYYDCDVLIYRLLTVIDRGSDDWPPAVSFTTVFDIHLIFLCLAQIVSPTKCTNIGIPFDINLPLSFIYVLHIGYHLYLTVCLC